MFRALVYNKGAAVLHMLRRLVGDDEFFRGLRRFYRESRFRKVGTDDLRVAMEKESGKTLNRFFQQWIFGSTIPRVRVGYRLEGTDVVVARRADRRGIRRARHGDAAVCRSKAGRRADSGHRAGGRAPRAARGLLRGVEISKDDGMVAEIVKGS